MGAQLEGPAFLRRIVTDTGPILHLAEASALDLLPVLGEIRIPGAVAAELNRYQPNIGSTSWLAVVELDDGATLQARRWWSSGLLDSGESEALALAQATEADWFLTDDAAARLLATSLGVETHGSLGVVLASAALGYISRSEGLRVLDRLKDSSLWVSRRVLNQAREALMRLQGS